MGTLLGNLLALIFIIIAALVGLHSLQASLATFLAFGYSAWLLLTAVDISTRPPQNGELTLLLPPEQQDAYRRYHLFLWAPGAAEAFSSTLNNFRLAGVVWAALAFWNGLYFSGIACIAYFFVVGSIVLKLNPLLYLGRPAQAGNTFAQHQLLLIQAVQEKRATYNAEE